MILSAVEDCKSAEKSVQAQISASGLQLESALKSIYSLTKLKLSFIISIHTNIKPNPKKKCASALCFSFFTNIHTRYDIQTIGNAKFAISKSFIKANFATSILDQVVQILAHKIIQITFAKDKIQEDAKLIAIKITQALDIKIIVAIVQTSTDFIGQLENFFKTA